MERQKDEQLAAGEDTGEGEVEGHRASLPNRLNHPHSPPDVGHGDSPLRGDRAAEPQQRQGQEGPWTAEVAGHGFRHAVPGDDSSEGIRARDQD